MTRTDFPAHAPPPARPDAVPLILEQLETRLPAAITTESPAAASRGMLIELELPSLLLAGEHALARRALAALVDLADVVWTTSGRRGPISIAFDGKRYSGVGGPVHYSCTTSLWTAAVHRALVARRRDGIDAALGFPPELLDSASSLVSDEYKAELARALRALLSGVPTLAGEHIARARELTQPAIATIGGPRLARCAREQLGMLRAIATGDQAAFDRAAWAALTAHQAIAGRGRARHRPDAYFSWPVLGLAALAVDRGLAWRIECAYAPTSWVEQVAS